MSLTGFEVAFDGHDGDESRDVPCTIAFLGADLIVIPYRPPHDHDHVVWGACLEVASFNHLDRPPVTRVGNGSVAHPTLLVACVIANATVSDDSIDIVTGTAVSFLQLRTYDPFTHSFLNATVSQVNVDESLANCTKLVGELAVLAVTLLLAAVLTVYALWWWPLYTSPAFEAHALATLAVLALGGDDSDVGDSSADSAAVDEQSPIVAKAVHVPMPGRGSHAGSMHELLTVLDNGGGGYGGYGGYGNDDGSVHPSLSRSLSRSMSLRREDALRFHRPSRSSSFYEDVAVAMNAAGIPSSASRMSSMYGLRPDEVGGGHPSDHGRSDYGRSDRGRSDYGRTATGHGSAAALAPSSKQRSLMDLVHLLSDDVAVVGDNGVVVLPDAAVASLQPVASDAAVATPVDATLADVRVPFVECVPLMVRALLLNAGAMGDVTNVLSCGVYLFTRFGTVPLYVDESIADVTWVASAGLLVVSAALYVRTWQGAFPHPRVMDIASYYMNFMAGEWTTLVCVSCHTCLSVLPLLPLLPLLLAVAGPSGLCVPVR